MLVTFTHLVRFCSGMVNNIRPVHPGCNLLVKYADNLACSVPLHGNRHQSTVKVNSVKKWAERNRGAAYQSKYQIC